jgi:protein-arginine kinase activator protein McsA
MRKHLTAEVKALLERDENNQAVCTNCHTTFKSLGSFYYHSIGCVTLPLTDERHELLAQLS